MQKILNKRVFRDLKSNFFRYLALFLLIVLGMYLVVAIVDAAESVIRGVEKGQEDNSLEDGQFGVFVPLHNEEIKQIEEKGVILENSFYMDYREEDATLRIYKKREKMNLFSLREGKQISEKGEILLEQHYADAHKLSLGDQVSVGKMRFEVVGIGSTPDYDAALGSMADSSVDSKLFGTGFVTEEDYNTLKDRGESFKTEEYIYSYQLKKGVTHDDLKEQITSYELDRSQITDAYFLEMLDEAEKTKNEILDGVGELQDGCNELSDGLKELADHNSDLTEAADMLFQTMLAQMNDSLKESGISVTLKPDLFEQQLDEMLASPEKYSDAMKASLQETKKMLLQLQAYRDGVKKYTDGVDSATKGNRQLNTGLASLTKNNVTLNKAVNQLWSATLAKANASLKTYGVPALTKSNYQKQLKGLIAAAKDQSMKNAFQEVLANLQSIAGFQDGLRAYTDGAANAKKGSKKLWNGMKQLTKSSPELTRATNQLFRTMLTMVNQQLKDSGLDVVITENNFETILNQLAASNSLVDTKLKKGLQESKETLQGLEDFQRGITDYTEAVRKAANGSEKLTNGVRELKKEADKMVKENFDYDLDNLTSFVTSEDNPRVGGSVNDVLINKYAGMIAGVIIMILFTYVISVFVVHNIEKECSIIGALYALGVKRRQLILHYLVLPVIVTVLGALTGGILGFSPIGVQTQMADAIHYFSMPTLSVVFPLYLVVYVFVMPPVVAVIVNYLVINKKLKRTALSLIRNEQKASKIRDINLGNLNFVRRFQIRQMLREVRSGLTVVGGMFISLLVLMMAINCYVLCKNYSTASNHETKYDYMYSYKYPTKDVPEGGTACYMESLKRMAYGYNIELGILGLTEENPYFDVPVSTKKNEIVISSAAATKFGIKKGEKLVLSDEVKEQDYAFTVIEITPFDSSLYAFMDIDVMRELFNQEEDYYNVVFSSEELDIDSGRLYGTVSKENVKKASSIFVDMMWPMVIMMSVVAVIIFFVVMYLMMKVMVDRSAFSISLAKIFGYRKGEIKKLYLNGNFFIVALGAVICVPLSKIIMDAMYPYCISNVAIGMNLTFTWQLYAGIFIGIILCYLLINQILVGRLKKILPAEVLKNRE